MTKIPYTEVVVNSWYDYRALLACDIAGSAGRGEARLQEIRAVLRSALHESLDVAGLEAKEFLEIDTGDGLQLVAPPGLLKARLLHPLLPELSARIRAHNQRAQTDAQLRVRVALHAGEVCLDEAGAASGSPFEALARLLDAGPLRQAVQRGTRGTPVAAVLSQHYYEETVVHGHDGLEADAFTAADVHVKKYSARAWFWYPGSPVGPRVDPEPSVEPTPDRRPPAAARGSEQRVEVSGHGTGFVVQHGTQNVYRRDRG